MRPLGEVERGDNVEQDRLGLGEVDGLGAQSFSHVSIAYNDGAVGKNLAPYFRSVDAARLPLQDLYDLPRTHMIAKMVAGIETSRLLCYRVGWMKNYGMKTTRETSLAKWHACNVAFESANDAIEVHGAYGYSSEYPAERYLRNSRGAVIYEGTREIHQALQAEFALGYREATPLRRRLPAYPFAADQGATHEKR